MRTTESGTKKLRQRYLRASALVGTKPESIVRQVRHSADSWGPEWAALNRNVFAQVAFADFLDESLRPDAVATLYMPFQLRSAEFLQRVEQWRIRSASLHPHGQCPPRRQRKIEYILSLEFGQHPKHGTTGRLHAHALLYNTHRIPLKSLAGEWRDLNGIKNPNEPFIERYSPGPEGILYCIKTLGTDVDLVYFSRKLSLAMKAESSL